MKQLGQALRAYRIHCNDRQSDLAARLGVGLSTIKAMESGSPGVSIGCWMHAFTLMRIDTAVVKCAIDGASSDKARSESLVDQFNALMASGTNNSQQTKERQRARKTARV